MNANKRLQNNDKKEFKLSHEVPNFIEKFIPADSDKLIEENGPKFFRPEAESNESIQSFEVQFDNEVFLPEKSKIEENHRKYLNSFLDKFN